MEGFPGPLPDMDETFWASVLKRWSDACDTVVSLKKDLKKAQAEADRHQEKLHALQSREEELLREHNHLKEECKEYRDRSCALLKETEAFRRSQSQASSVGSHRPDDNTVDNIREAEHGLEKARHEYMKLKELLSKSSEQIRSLNTELKALQRDKEATEEHNCLLTKENIRIGLELTRSRSEYDALKEQLTVLQDLRNQNQGLKAEFIAQTQQLNNEIKRRNELESRCNTADAEVALRSQEIQVLTAAATVEKQHISALQDEILSMREKLSKSNETNKALLDNFTKLNEKLKDPTLAHPPQQSPRAVLTAPTKEEVVAQDLDLKYGVSTYRRMGSRIFIQPPSPPVHLNTASASNAAAERSTVQAASSFPALTPIPDARQRSLAELVHYIPDIDREDCRFRRGMLASALGGSIQCLIVRVTQSRTELARRRNISTYLCPALELNPWCPTSPGQHGYMFVGLGQDRNTFQEPQAGLNVFVGHSQTSSRPKEYRYLGVYTAVRVTALNIEEWTTLSKEVQYGYASTSKDKNKDPRSVDEILAAYGRGELSVPCVRLQCTDFDETLYAALVAAQLTPPPRLHPTPSRSSRAAGKRRRDDHEDHQVRPRVTRRSLFNEPRHESSISP